jgi:hypothetical protein
MIRMTTLFAGLAALLVAGCASEPPPAAAGYFLTSTYYDGPPAIIRVTVDHGGARDRISAVELIRPDGGVVLAHRHDTETVRETRGADPGYSGSAVGIGGGFGIGSGGFFGSGFSFGFPIGGGGAAETVTREIRTTAEIDVPDRDDYRAHWRAYKIRVTMNRGDGTTDITTLGPPPP